MTSSSSSSSSNRHRNRYYGLFVFVAVINFASIAIFSRHQQSSFISSSGGASNNNYGGRLLDDVLPQSHLPHPLSQQQPRSDITLVGMSYSDNTTSDTAIHYIVDAACNFGITTHILLAKRDEDLSLEKKVVALVHHYGQSIRDVEREKNGNAEEVVYPECMKLIRVGVSPGEEEIYRMTKEYYEYDNNNSSLMLLATASDGGGNNNTRQLINNPLDRNNRIARIKRSRELQRQDLMESLMKSHHNDDEDAGIEMRKRRRQELPSNVGHRVEVKNLNSLRQIVAAAEYEALRQSTLAIQNNPTGQETRTFHVKPSHPSGGETFCIRAKGDAVDYRFMPEPDLPPLILNEDTLNMLSLEEYIDMYMPESIEDAKFRLVNDYGLSEDVASLITKDPPAIALFEQTVKTARSQLDELEDDYSEEMMQQLPTLAANWLCNDLFALVKKSAVKETDTDEKSSDGTLNHPISVEYSAVNGERLGTLIVMIIDGKLTTSMAKKVLTIMYEDDNIHSLPQDIAKHNGWEVISNMETLIQLCESVILHPKNTSQLEQYKLGGKKIWKIEKYFVGKIMAECRGNAHPELMKEALSIVLKKQK